MEPQANRDQSDKEISSSRSHWWERLGWLVLIWSLSVMSLGIVAYGIKKIMNAAGMTT